MADAIHILFLCFRICSMKYRGVAFSMFISCNFFITLLTSIIIVFFFLGLRIPFKSFVAGPYVSI